MQIDRMTMAKARLAIRVAVAEFLFDPDRKINMIDVGMPIENGQHIEDALAIRFHVSQWANKARLEAAGKPSLNNIKIGEFEGNVIVGNYRPHPGLWWGGAALRPAQNPRIVRSDPLRGGISISDAFHNTYGTLGGLVTDRVTGDPMILSNWHVLVGDWRAFRNRPIYQPGRMHGGGGADAIAILERDAMSANLDAAVARISGNRPLINDQLGLGPVMGVGQARKGMLVKKVGCTSNLTYGVVTGLGGVSKMPYSGITRLIGPTITIEQRTSGEQVSAGGDSGSWWLDTETMQAVGLHFAGQDDPEVALALDMQSVLNALSIDIPNGAVQMSRFRRS
jgi:endonuclease G